jgi:hypothetical protein
MMDGEVGEEQTEMFGNMWFVYLKMVLSYVKNLKSVSQTVEENIKKVLNFVITEKNVLRED